MSEKDHKRDKSHAAWIRAKQDRAARKKWSKKEELITDENTDSFIANALRNGLDLLKIAREAAEKNKEENS